LVSVAIEHQPPSERRDYGENQANRQDGPPTARIASPKLIHW
jgi:hypothetical protein